MFRVALWNPFLLFFFPPQKGQGAPAREPLITDNQQKQMMMRYHKRQEELKVRTNRWRNSKSPSLCPQRTFLTLFFFVMFSET